MPKPFVRLSLEEFAEALRQYPWSRRVDAVHMHHTWIPQQRHFKGLKTIEGMWRFHTQERGWSDIAQHVTIAPDGSIWTGRDWNAPPVSSRGHNGNRAVGPFMFEIIGDYDAGADDFSGVVRETVVEVIALVQERWGLAPESLRFHRHLTDQKSCPGTGIDYEDVLAAVRAMRAKQVPGTDDGAESSLGVPGLDPMEPRPLEPFRAEALGAVPQFVRDARDRRDAALATRSRSGSAEPMDADAFAAEPAEETMTPGERAALLAALDGEGVRTTTSGDAAEARGARGPKKLPLHLVRALRPHVVNLEQGRYSSRGTFETKPEDVAAIFEEHLPRALAKAKGAGQPLRLLFHAHGGLVGETKALKQACEHLEFWEANGVYPIFFVWETGGIQTIRQLLERYWARVSGKGTRGVERGVGDWLAERTTDRLIEGITIRAGGQTIWGGMKNSARRASEKYGGARDVALRLRAFCREHGDAVAVHAVGHSAGAIFHAHFLPVAFETGDVRIETLHLLAPAIRTELFEDTLQKHVGSRIGHTTMYTMDKDTERDDTCTRFYRKSLLYLIRNGLEERRGVSILGLEEAVRKERDLKKLFGLGGADSEVAEVIWSPSHEKEAEATGRRASMSTAHGDFDEDPPTMNSIARRVLALGDDEPLPLPYESVCESTRSKRDPWTAPLDLDALLLSEPPRPALAAQSEAFATAAPSSAEARPAASAPEILLQRGGRKRALCVGINRYHRKPLQACVRDANAWAALFGVLGFEEPAILLDADATRQNMVEQLRRLVRASRAGDVLAFQFAGHGTDVPDYSGDETESHRDQAFCPVDYHRGQLLLDDDVGALFDALPEGVSLTCFIDCCHSGSSTRLAERGIEARPGNRVRELPLTLDEIDAFAAVRGAMPGDGQSRTVRSRGGNRTMRGRPYDEVPEVLFSACTRDQLAEEDAEHGIFTNVATRLLRKHGASAFTNEQFARQVARGIRSYGYRQTAEYHGPDDAKARGLLAPLPQVGGISAVGRDASPNNRALVGQLRQIADALEGRRDG